MNLNQIRIVLVGTTHPGNIGSAARAMKTMGLSSLYLVAPRSFPHQSAVDMASGADDLLARANIVETLPEALSGCHLVLATSARPRDLDLPGMLPNQAAQYCAQNPENACIAVLFGREHAGLTNDELLHAHYHIQIPANADYASLNLAMAVQIICYELRLAMLDTNHAITHTQLEDKASADEVEGLLQHFLAVMDKINFYKSDHPGRLPQRMRRLFNRAQLEKREVNFLRGFLTETMKKM